jgi:hypothetical protein
MSSGLITSAAKSVEEDELVAAAFALEAAGRVVAGVSPESEDDPQAEAPNATMDSSAKLPTDNRPRRETSMRFSPDH